jgi:hypothetical protein
VIPPAFAGNPSNPRDCRSHGCAIKVAGEDLLEILPTIDRVSRKVIEPSSGCVSQVNREELDDEEVIVRPTRLAREAVVLQPNIGICVAIILDDVVGHTEMPREARIMHVAPERFRSWPLRAKAAPFLIAAPATTLIACVVLGVGPFIHPPPLTKPDGMPKARGISSGGLIGDGTGPMLMKTRFPPWSDPSWSFVGWP